MQGSYRNLAALLADNGEWGSQVCCEAALSADCTWKLLSHRSVAASALECLVCSGLKPMLVAGSAATSASAGAPLSFAEPRGKQSQHSIDSNGRLSRCLLPLHAWQTAARSCGTALTSCLRRCIFVSNHLPLHVSKSEAGDWQFEWNEDALLAQAKVLSCRSSGTLGSAGLSKALPRCQSWPCSAAVSCRRAWARTSSRST